MKPEDFTKTDRYAEYVNGGEGFKVHITSIAEVNRTIGILQIWDNPALMRYNGGTESIIYRYDIVGALDVDLMIELVCKEYIKLKSN